MKSWTSTKSPEYDRAAVSRLIDLSEQFDECWIWTGPKNGSGYGIFSYRGRNQSAHRVAYRLLVGEIPDGLQLDHLCRKRSCINPAHLEPVTRLENVRRGKRPKLTIEAAREIRQMLAEPLGFLMDKYGVSARTLLETALGNRWAEDDQAMKERK